ncbi:Fe-S cluster assembly protein SufD [Pararhizobium mangrovi]|uniref:Fe-S cluster assembly protein SufD n=1 Tax=Pararhizobium mangrovi TaxID=2590452 RepID=A0A506U1J6_9HYPH|nr:Fe-S cluster assembly protein SufD [Pararhizobium mangrovi]TPW26825.1 Fe-S cluster assembly protein SufD [Pararhizobium mangrovi]
MSDHAEKNARPPATAAETSVFDSYDARIDALPGSSAVRRMRDRLMSELQDQRLPHRRMEAWHYTDLRTLLKAVPEAFGTGGEAKGVAPLVDGSNVLTVNNGEASVEGAPEGVSVSRFADRLNDESVVEFLAAQGPEDAVSRINGAFVSDGLVVDVAPGTVLDAPLEIQAVHSTGQAHTRFPVTIGKGAKGSIVERQCASGEGAAFTSSITDLTVGDDAEIDWIILQEQGDADTHLARVNLRLGANAKLMLYVVNAGGKLVRQEVRAVVEGEGSDFKLRGINLLGGESHTDVTMVLDHTVPSTTSTEVLRNVVFGKAHGVFQGQIRVAQAAQQTDAQMACNTLLLSDDADFSAKPELEIFADDVQCGHGATVADIDKNHLFYLMSRGIPAARARGMLVYAFLAEVVEELDDERLVPALESVIAEWLRANG